MKRTLTDRFLKSVPAATTGKHTDYADSIVPGLAVRVSGTGKKTFVLVNRFPGSKSRIHYLAHHEETSPPPAVCSRGNAPARVPPSRSTSSAVRPPHSNS